FHWMIVIVITKATGNKSARNLDLPPPGNNGGFLDCGGKRSATPLSHTRDRSNFQHLLSVRKRRRRCTLPAQSKFIPRSPSSGAPAGNSPGTDVPTVFGETLPGRGFSTSHHRSPHATHRANQSRHGCPGRDGFCRRPSNASCCTIRRNAGSSVRR